MQTGRMERPFAEEMQQSGFLAIERVLDPREIEEARCLIDPLFERNAHKLFQLGKFGTSDTPELQSPSDIEPGLRKLNIISTCEIIANAILQCPTVFSGDHAIYKQPKGTSPTAWHQDEAYRRGLWRCNSVTIWIPLQSVNNNNGCMRFIKGSHLEKLHRHKPRDDDPRNHAKEIASFECDDIVECPLEIGGLTAHLPRTIHGTSNNNSDEMRRAWILSFSSTKFYNSRRIFNFLTRRLLIGH